MEGKLFILDLIQNNEIVNYKASKEIGRKIYNEHYRPHMKVHYWIFLMELWSQYVVAKFDKNKIHFNRKWLDSLETKGNNNIYNNKKVVAADDCELCRITSREEDLRKLLNAQKVPWSFVCAKHTHHTSSKVKVEIFEDGKPVTEVKKTIREKIVVTIKITNTSKFPISVDIIKINKKVTELQVVISGKPDLQPDDIASFHVLGEFENSFDFVFPLVLSIKLEEKSAPEYFLIELPVIISSDYSFLATKDVYVTSKSVNNPAQSFKVVKGKKLKIKGFEEKISLLPYQIPKYIKDLIGLIIKTTPEFITNQRNSVVNYRDIEHLFGIQDHLKKNNYCSMLHTLLYIEENQMMEDAKKMKLTSKLKRLADDMYALNDTSVGETLPTLLVGNSIKIWQRQQEECRYEGIIHGVKNNVLLGFGSRLDLIHSDNVEYNIQFDYSRRPLKVEHQALNLVQKHNIEQYFFPQTVTALKSHPSKLDFFSKNFNEEQKTAVQNILQEKNCPYLVFGPPGTGKTSTLVEAILQVWKTKPNTKILVCTPSNASATEIAERLAQVLTGENDFFRLVGTSCHNSRLTDLGKRANVTPDGDCYTPKMASLVNYRIIVTTLVTSARLYNGGFKPNHFAYVFIDESGYATESQSLVPVAGFLSSSRLRGKIGGQLVLAGDPNQLGALIKSNFVAHHGLGVSMLERLMSTCNVYMKRDKYDERVITKLVKSYRSHPEILRVPNELFYDKELISVENETMKKFAGWKWLPTRDFPLIFHNIEGEDRRDANSPSYYNVQEIEVVMDYLLKLLEESGVKQEEIGIITPYGKQVKNLQQVCRTKHWGNILIGSVEQFQGKEKDVIIISTVRSRSGKNFDVPSTRRVLGFLKNPKRFNVAITRAKALLIIIGNAHFLGTDKYWNKILQHCKNNNSVVGTPLDSVVLSEPTTCAFDEDLADFEIIDNI